MDRGDVRDTRLFHEEQLGLRSPEERDRSRSRSGRQAPWGSTWNTGHPSPTHPAPYPLFHVEHAPHHSPPQCGEVGIGTTTHTRESHPRPHQPPQGPNGATFGPLAPEGAERRGPWRTGGKPGASHGPPEASPPGAQLGAATPHPIDGTHDRTTSRSGPGLRWSPWARSTRRSARAPHGPNSRG